MTTKGEQDHPAKDKQIAEREHDGKPVATSRFSLQHISTLIALVALIASNYNTCESLRLTRQGQRAWIGVESMDIRLLEVGKQTVAEVSFVNSGPTFARAHKMRATMHGASDPFDVDLYAISPARPEAPLKSVHVFVPKIPTSVRVTGTNLLDQTTMDRIQNGTVTLYVFGEVEYTDVFGVGHVTKYCGYWVPPKKKFASCEKYNEAD